jgi:hypothetical protein
MFKNTYRGTTAKDSLLGSSLSQLLCSCLRFHLLAQ